MGGRTELRLFVALWPSRGEARATHDYARSLTCVGGRSVAERNIHLTLAFLGAVGAERLAGLEAMMARIEAPAFDLHFDRVGHWRRPGVVWVGCGTTPRALGCLVGALREGLRGQGFGVERRRFAAHVTLFRKVVALDPTAQAPGLHWRCREVVLVASSLQPGGAHYEVLQRFPLAGVDPHPL